MRIIIAMLAFVSLLLPSISTAKAADAIRAPTRIGAAMRTSNVSSSSLLTARPVRSPAFTVIMQSEPSHTAQVLDSPTFTVIKQREPAQKSQILGNWSFNYRPANASHLEAQATVKTAAPSRSSTEPTAAAKSIADPETPQTQSATSSDAALATYNSSTPLPVQGNAMYYNPGIMQEVLGYRLKMGEVQTCNECVGYVALLRKGDLNRKVWIQLSDAKVEGPFLVIDVAARHHVALLLARNWVVDVDYATAQRWGMNRPIPVTILEQPPQVASTSPMLEAVSSESPFGK